MMNIIYPQRDEFLSLLKTTAANSLDFIVIVTAAFTPLKADDLKKILYECVRVLKSGGLLFVQGRPEYLPELGVHLDQYLNFKYWIAIESTLHQRKSGLPTVHAAVLLFTKGNDRFNIKRTRLPHQYCHFCHRTLKDWGGKAHLMNPEGYVISDVWRDLPIADNYSQLSKPVLDTILRMLDFEPSDQNTPRLFQQSDEHLMKCELNGIIGPKEGIQRDNVVADPAFQYSLPGILRPIEPYNETTFNVSNELFDVVHCGDAVEILKRYPDNSIDLVFADPPYNLDKPYGIYDDERENKRYIDWCNSWLSEYVRILKPTGSLFVLNLPRWTMYHAQFLNQRLYFQNWIVWEALSEPRGKLMPAHYGLLFYTKHPTSFTFNYDEVSQLDVRYYCLRSSCIRKRKALGIDDKEPLTDFWWNVHRIKHRRDRDYHPCQLPEALLERIIRLATNPGDIVLDALCGTGTTPITAFKLGRRYVAIDIDPNYVQITKQKLAEIEQNGFVRRPSIRKPQREYTKKELQLELRKLAAHLGRLPTPEDVRKMSQYDVQLFFDMFPSWNKALKAARLEVQV
ncbi:MAG: DNA methyltransferase [candidate division KSB1 bacterium]|nr:DNA methyltransferase [candidate division KSB1 bacterium]MDZ7335972.1 DNA methyltransferase [candidate division KSB1 bacterium]MDZ7357938.1 DNA methyltransferase [candidate division KSB1 bacterium]MDZ7402193.1 DNA methyltransferase [candidate division KSB1 bacterium]